MRVCYFGTYRANYSRNKVMIEGLRRNGVEVIVCHEPLWHGVEDRVQVASGGWLRPGFVVRVLRAYWNLIRAYRNVPAYDVMVLGYPGQIDAYLARLLTWLRRKPLVLDVFMSLYLIASERELTARHPLTARLLHGLEKMACSLPDLLILDTAEYVRWFQSNYGLDPTRFCLVPTGADDKTFQPVKALRREGEPFRLLYYGTFIPNHGVEHIVEAAELLRDQFDIHFELIGDGPTKAQAMSFVREQGLTNVHFGGWVEEQALLQKAAKADVCLGVFGTTPQSLMTVQNKIYQGLAMARPVITGDGPAVSQALVHGEHIYLCERANPRSLADAILTLQDDPVLCSRLARRGHRFYLQNFTPDALGRTAAICLYELVLGRMDCEG